MKLVSWYAFVFLAVFSSTNAFSAKSIVIDSHEVPLPAAASPELRKSILELPSVAGFSLPTSAKEWVVLQDIRNKERSAGAEAIATALKVTIHRTEIDGVRVVELVPDTIKASNQNRLFIHLHGGAYVFGSGDAGLFEGALLANRLNIKVASIDYGMPPDSPFPAAVNDVVTVYKQLLKKFAPNSLIIGGTSAGGGLAFAAVHKFRQAGIPVPGAIYGGTPWVDLTKTGDTHFTNAGLDRILVSYDGMLRAAALLYASGHDLKNELISPLYGSFEKFPPAFLVTGTRDLFLSDVARMHRKLRASGVQADLHVYEGMSHADYLVVANSPESIDMFGELDRFLQTQLVE